MKSFLLSLRAWAAGAGLLCVFLLPHAHGAKADARSGGAGSSADIPLPPRQNYVTIRLLPDYYFVPYFYPATLTDSGRVLLKLAYLPANTIQSNNVVGYRWHEGVLEELMAPALPWIYGGYSHTYLLRYSPEHMNDSGDVVGYSRHHGDFYDDASYSRYPGIKLREETLTLSWAIGSGPIPILVNPGIVDSLQRARLWAIGSFDGFFWIDDSGNIYANRSFIAEYIPVRPYISHILSGDALKWENPAASWQKLTGSGSPIPLGYRLETMSSNGTKLFSNYISSVQKSIIVGDRVFPTELSNLSFPVINNNSRFVGYDFTQKKIVWGSATEDLAYLEGSPRALNNRNDVLGRGLTGVYKIWRWMDTGEGNWSYKDVVIDADTPATDDFSPIHINKSGMLAGAQYKTRDAQGNPLAQQTSTPVLLVPADLIVDANHDGMITLNQENFDPALFDQTTATRPYFAASNKNDHNPGPTAEPDYLNTSVDGPEDLADFFPLFLDIKELLTVLPPGPTIKYKLKQAGGAMNFVYTSLTAATAFDYEAAGAVALDYGPNQDKAAHEAPTHQITAAGIDLFQLDPDLETRIKTQDQGVILVELRGMTSAPLKLVVEKNNVQIAEVTVNIATGEVEWESPQANNQVKDFKIPPEYANYTSKDLKWLEGKRYFTDGDGPTATFHRTRINVKVKMAGAAGKSVKLKAFDVDDPTPTEWDPENIVDPNDAANGATGGDNDTGASVFAGTFATSTTDTINTTLDGNGEATVEFITTQKPGANYRIAAVLSEAAVQLDTL